MYLHYADFMPVDWHPQLKGETEGMRRLALAVVLACVLSGTSTAGEIPTTGVPAPQTSSSVVTTGEIPSSDRTLQLSSTGEIPSSDRTESESSAIVLAILLSIFSIAR